MDEIIGVWNKVEMYDIENLLKEWQVNWIVRKFATFINPKILLSTSDGRYVMWVIWVHIGPCKFTGPGLFSPGSETQF